MLKTSVVHQKFGSPFLSGHRVKGHWIDSLAIRWDEVIELWRLKESKNDMLLIWSWYLKLFTHFHSLVH